jgi:N-methylhydantoinase B
MAVVTRVVDPITVEVVRHTITAIADEMEANLTRTAFSPIVYESKDFCAALLDIEGNMIGQAMGSLPVFLCDLGNAIQDIQRIYGLENVEPGDMFAANDPNVFGQHLNNVVVTLPIFWEGRVAAFVAVRAHWIDIGGRDPGGWNADTTEIWQEGLQIPTVKLVKRGMMDDELARLIALNVRTPEPVFGDLRAQIAACHLGARRFLLMLEKYGLEMVSECIRTIWDQSEQRVRDAIAAIPDGVYTAEAQLDDDGVRKDVPVRLPVRVVVAGSEITVDFSDVPEQNPGPLNSGPAAAMAVARIAVKMITTPLEIANEGGFRPIKIILPEGTMLSARRGAPVAQWSPALATLIDLVLAALSEAIPDRIPAGSREDVGGTKIFPPLGSARRWYYMHPCPGGWGGLPFRDGVCGMKSLNHGDSLVPAAEILEASTPVLIEEEVLKQDSGGAGQFRGGLGTRRTFRVREDAIGAFSMHRASCPPWGLFGGEPGTTDMFFFDVPGREPFAAPKVENIPLPAGSRIVMETAGGGGWGDPLTRDPARVALDVRRGYVSPVAARDKYGVVLDASGAPDLPATHALREQLRASPANGGSSEG